MNNETSIRLDGSSSNSKNENFIEQNTSKSNSNSDTPQILSSMPILLNDPKVSKNVFEKFRSKFLDAIESTFEAMANISYDNSVFLIILSLSITLFLTTGLLFIEVESDMYKLYAMNDSPSVKSKEDFESIFHIERLETFILSSERNILTSNDLTEIDHIFEAITKIRFPKEKILEDSLFPHIKRESEPYIGYPDIIDYNFVCLKDHLGKCIKTLASDIYPNQEDYGKPISANIYPYYLSSKTHSFNRIDSLIGDIKIDESSNKIIEAKSMLNNFALSGSPDLAPASAVFELVAEKFLKSWKYDPSVKIINYFERTLNDDLHQASTLRGQDLMFIAIAIVLVCAYALISKFTKASRSKGVMVALGVGLGLLAYTGGMGICYLLGMKHIATTEATPFVIIGIAADDSFIIVNAYDLTYGTKDPRQRIKNTMRNSGLSITLATLTNVIAFMVGTYTPFYSIRVFCIATSVCLILGYILCLTCFVPLLSIEARKECANRYTFTFSDFFPNGTYRINWLEKLKQKFKSKKFKTNSTIQMNVVNYNHIEMEAKANSKKESYIASLSVTELISAQYRFEKYLRKLFEKRDELKSILSFESLSPKNSLNNFSSTTHATDSEEGSCISKPEMSNTEKLEKINATIFNLKAEYSLLEEPQGNSGKSIRRFIRKSASKIFSNTFYGLIVITIFLAHLAICCYFFTKLNYGLAIEELVLKDSPTYNFIDGSQENFGNFFEKVYVYFPEVEPWHTKELQDQLLALNKELKKNPVCTEVINGMSNFITSNANSLIDGDQTTFNDKLKDYLNSTLGSRFSRDFVFDESGNLKHFEFLIYIPFVDNTLDSYYQLETILDIIKVYKAYFKVQAFTKFAVLWESDPTILQITLMSLAFVHLAIFIISILLIPGMASPIYALAMIICIDISLFGHMAIWNIKLNMVSMVVLLLSIGYSVDYTVHILHAFQQFKTKSRLDCAVKTVSMMSIPLFDGMISTFIPALVIGFSDKYILNLFFQMMTIILLFSFLHGVVLLPILLSFYPFETKVRKKL